MNIKRIKLGVLSSAVILMLVVSSFCMTTSDNDGNDAYATPIESYDSEESETTFGNLFTNLQGMLNIILKTDYTEYAKFDKNTISGNVEISEDTYIADNSSIVFENNSQITVKTGKTLTIAGNVSMSGPVKVTIESGASLRVGNFNILGGLNAPTVINASSGLNIGFKNICDEKSNYWNLYIDVDVLGETLSIVSDNTTTGEKYSSRITDNGISSELTISAALGLNSDLLKNTDAVNIMGMLDLLDKFSADRTLIPAVDVSAAIDNIEYIRTDNTTSTSLIAYDLYASMKTSAEGFVADVSFEDISVYKTETDTSDSGSKITSKNIANTLYSAEQCKINLVWNDKITLSGKISGMRYESIEGQYTITEDTGYTLTGSASTDRGSLSQMSVEADLSAEGLKELLKDPLTIDFSKIKTEVKIKASIDDLKIDSNSQTYYYVSDEPIAEDKINDYLTLDNWTRINASIEIALEFSTNGNVSADMKLKEFSILSKNTDVNNPENDHEIKIYVKGASVNIDASHAQIMKLICYTIIYKEDVELTDVLPIILDKSKIDIEVGLEEFTLSNKEGDRDFEIGIASNTPGKQAANVKLGITCMPTINPLKPNVSASLTAELTPDSAVSIKDVYDGVNSLLNIYGLSANVSLNGSLDIVGLLNEDISKFALLTLNAEASVKEIELIEYSNENYTRMVLENLGFKKTLSVFELSQNIYYENYEFLNNITIPSVTVYSGINKNEHLDTSKPYDHFIFKNGRITEDGELIFNSPEIVKSINTYADTITGKDTGVLPAAFNIEDGKFCSDPFTMSLESELHGGVCIPAYEVEGLYNKTFTIAAGTKISVFPTGNSEGFIGWYVDGSLYTPGTIITVDRDLFINESYESYVSTEFYVDDKLWETIRMAEGVHIDIMDPVLENHKFVGWFDSEGKEVLSGNLICTNGGKYYAHFKPLPSISFYDGEKLLKTFYDRCGNYILYYPEDLKDGTFAGWVKTEGEDPEYSEIRFTDDNQKFYAVYYEKFTVTFKDEDKTISEIRDIKGAVVIPPVLENKTDSRFIGWKNVKGDIVTYVEIGTSDETFFAVFEDYAVINVIADGKTITIYGMKGTKASLSNIPVIEGKRFVGCFADSEFTTPAELEFKSTATTYYAKYTDLSKIEFISGNDTLSTVYGISGTVCIQDIPSIEGKKIIGWYADKELSVLAELKFGETAQKVYAKTVDIITVKFVYGDEELSSVTGEAGEKYKTPSDPICDGYRFMGWYDNSEFKGNAVTPSGIFDSNKIYYAKIVKEYTVIFDYEDGYYERTGISGEEIEVPAGLAKEGFVFSGWYPGNMTAGDKYVVGNCDATFTAVYAAIITPGGFTPEEGYITIENANIESGYITKGNFDSISNGLGDNDALKIVLKNGIIVLPKGAVDKINGSEGDKTITMTRSLVTQSVLDRLSSSDKDRIMNGTIISIDIANAETNGLGTVKVTVEYKLPEGMDADDIRVYYLGTDGLSEHKYRYFVGDDGLGYVEFETDHFSDFAIGKAIDSSDDSGNATIYIAIAAVLVIVALGAVFFLKKRGTI